MLWNVISGKNVKNGEKISRIDALDSSDSDKSDKESGSGSDSGEKVGCNHREITILNSSVNLTVPTTTWHSFKVSGTIGQLEECYI